MRIKLLPGESITLEVQDTFDEPPTLFSVWPMTTVNDNVVLAIKFYDSDERVVERPGSRMAGTIVVGAEL